jgi:hypothetical protein
MRRRPIRQLQPSYPNSVEREQMIKILSLEYEALRSSMLTLTSGRYQFFGLMTTAAALLATGVSHSSSSDQKWILGSLALTTFIVGLIYFLHLGQHIIGVSARLANIEDRINELAYSQTKLLSWESEHQQRNLWKQISLGSPFRKSPN